MGAGHLPFPRSLIEGIQRPVREFFRTQLSAPHYALFRALILGERQSIDQQLREPFHQTGLGHILAVSGLHIGLVAWVSFCLFKWLLSRSYKLSLKINIQKLTALLTCLPVIGYAFLAGCQVSSQRAMIMVLTFLCSVIVGREREIWSTVALAALLILAIDPHAIFSISFQLSFSAVIGILWLTTPVLNRIRPHIEALVSKRTILAGLLNYSIGLIVVCLCATVFLLPLTSFYFHRLSLVSVPANFTAMPILGLWVLPLGLLSAVTLPLSYEVASFFLKLATWGLGGMMDMIRFWAALPFSSFWVISPSLLEMLMFYLLLLFIFFHKKWPWAKIGIACLTILFFSDLSYWAYSVRFNEDLRVTFLDVGQANCALVEFPKGKKMLIDGGGFPGDQFDVGKMVVAPYLWHAKILHIDYLVLSHPQADHMNGLRFIAKTFNPKEFWYNGMQVDKASFRELMSIVESKRIQKLLPADLANGREINGVKVEILHPEPTILSSNRFDKSTRLNNNSLVLKISYGGRSVLFPGDLERQGEAVLVSRSGQDLRSDILLSPHHGSRNSSSEDFLQMVRPHICVISSGEENFFGFPHRETLKRLHAIDCRVIRIDQSGAVQLKIHPREFEIRTFIPSQAKPFSKRPRSVDKRPEKRFNLDARWYRCQDIGKHFTNKKKQPSKPLLGL
jgi:competence protein ComEC